MLRYTFYLFVFTLPLAGCFSKKNTLNIDKLPKDISLMPKRYSDYTLEEQRIIDEERMKEMLTSLHNTIATVDCTNPTEWRISPLGSKPCGGSAAFIAYPIQLEETILPQITKYNRESSAFNLKYGIISDCNVVPAPSGVKCEEGNAVLVYETNPFRID